jgi:8-oxo-dGTP diphosphatase
VRICAGGVLVRANEIFLVKRSDDRAFYPGVWDVVGGHCEAGESPADTLRRELYEELGIRPLIFGEVDVLGERQPGKYGEARYHMFAVTAWTGAPRLANREHSELRWVKLDEALSLPLAHPDYWRLFRTILEAPDSGSFGGK